MNKTVWISMLLAGWIFPACALMPKERPLRSIEVKLRYMGTRTFLNAEQAKIVSSYMHCMKWKVQSESRGRRFPAAAMLVVYVKVNGQTTESHFMGFRSDGTLQVEIRGCAAERIAMEQMMKGLLRQKDAKEGTESI